MSNNKDFKVKNGIKPAAYHEAVGTVVPGSVGYSLATASYDSVSFSVSAQDTLPVAFAMKDDGTALYMHGATNDSLYQYTLSTAWDLSTISYDSKSFLTSTQNGNAGPVTFKSDGTSFYVSGSTNDTVYQYDMGTAWDISTASYASKSFSVSGQETVPTGLFFKSDGTKMYMLGSGTNAIYQYTLSTAWDVSTASYDSVTFSLSAQGTSTTSLYFKSDGTQFYTTDTNGVFKYNLSTAWDISTASYAETYNTTSESTSPYQSWVKSDGTKMFVLGLTNDSIYQYSTVLSTASLDLSTGSVFEITPTSDIRINLSNPADSGTVSQATLLLDGALLDAYDVSTLTYTSRSLDVGSQDIDMEGVYVKPDGTSIYTVGYQNDTVRQYDMTTAWDISTASLANSFSVSSQETTPAAVSFKPDGTVMYVMGFTGDDVNQYTLSTAWDITTATYEKNFSVSSQTSQPKGVTFSSDGMHFYVVAGSSNILVQYDMTTAWDVGTASYSTKSFSLTGIGTSPSGCAISDDGTTMFVVNTGNDVVGAYTLSTPYDANTATLTAQTSVSAQGAFPGDVTVGKDGSKLYIVDANADAVHEYDMGNLVSVTYDDTIQFAGGSAPSSPAGDETDVVTFSTRDGGTSYLGTLAIDGAV